MNAPDPTTFDPQDPSPEMLLWAYRRGIFPMADLEADEINWYSPESRGLIPLDGFRVPKSLARVVRNSEFEIRSDTDLKLVMQACAGPRRDGCWINERLIEAYINLHERGHAHCIEAWLDDILVGGLYGVHIGGAFFGESMFIRPDQGGTNASKVCLVHLVRWLRHRGFALLDTQFWNPHLDQFGCVEISCAAYLAQLDLATNMSVSWGLFSPIDEDQV